MGLRPLGPARRGHLGNPRRPQEVPVFTAHVLVAIERAIRLATRRGLPADLERWRKARDAIYRRIVDRGWSPTLKAFVQYEGGDVVDAAVLLMPLVKFISPTDPKWLSTLDALTASLVSDSLVYRYNPRASPDGCAAR
jgi:GH15 family glucan-1,4-alpha-glucosidase